MKIKAVKLFENGYMIQPMAFGGEEGMEKYDPTVRYRSSLQNYVIETEDEVILVDTGMPDGTPEQIPDEKTVIFMGNKISDYVEALEKAGYKPEQVSKILITHKHADHTGAIGAFPNAKIYISPEDAEELENKGDNVVAVSYKDGSYHNFPAAEKIAEGIYLVEAKGHTKGNSIVIAEDEGLFYMIHGDITYTDEALYENKLSIVFEDPAAARVTLDNVRQFISENPTVYVSTHTPLGYENLEAKKVIDLANPPATVPVGEIKTAQASGKYICGICGYIYDPAEHDGVAFEDQPEDWKCPKCKQGKDKFTKA